MSKTHVFISYAPEDREQAEPIVSALKATQVPVWVDQDIRADVGWVEEMESALNDARVIVFIVSPAFLASDWANVEIGMAMSRQLKSGIRVLAPIVRDSLIPSWLDKFEFLDARTLPPEDVAEQIKRIAVAHEDPPETTIEFYSCFISYSSKDEEFARRLHGKMRDAHLRVWFAPEDMPGGRKLHEEIETQIRLYDKLLLVLSEASLQSEWVMKELRHAFEAQRKSHKRKLFPVRLVDFERLRDWECRDSQSGTDLAAELREYFIPNFSNWKDHDSFDAAFARLLKDLKAEVRAVSSTSWP
jgi:hypothetical protein